jgi:hypothetical protein
VHALVVYDGALIAGGAFTRAGDQPASRIARWDGAQWTSLGSGMNGTVLALEVYNGELIAGGYFTEAGGQLANYIARWDGAQWRSLSSGTNSTVVALAVHNGELIAGGGFTQAGGAPVNYIAGWNGVHWRALGGGMNDWVAALTVWGPGPIAGGGFNQAGDQATHRIAEAMPIGPNLTEQPAAQEAYTGQAISFSVSASGTGLLGYQWYKDDCAVVDNERISGATTGTLRIDPVILADGGHYKAVATDACASSTSGPASLIILFQHADLNCDGAVNFKDINPFVLALSSWGSYLQQYPDCDIMLVDCNGDGYVTFKDINPFVAILLPGAVNIEHFYPAA